MPDFMKGDKGGVENIGQSDIETPRIKLLQAVSPECEEFDAAVSGNYWHSVAEVDLGDEVEIIPIYIDQRAILWRPRHDGGGILARADDGVHWNVIGEWEVKPVKGSKQTAVWRTAETVAASGLLEWGSSIPEDPNSPPAATRMYNMVVALPQFPELGFGVVTLQRASIKVARKFLGKLKLSNMPTYGTRWTMSTVKDANPSGDEYNNYKFTAAGFVQNEAEYHAYKDLYERFKEMGLQIKDLESAQDEGGQAEVTEGPARKGVNY